MIRLRKIEPTDLPYLYRWENDPSAWPMGDVHNPLSQQDLREYIASTTGDCFRDGQLRLMITTEEGATVGCVDLFDLDCRNRKAALGIYVDPAFRQQGVATAALGAMRDWAFGQLGLRMLYAYVSLANSPAVDLFRRAGFAATAPIPSWTLEGDAVLYTLCSEGTKD